MGAFEITTEIRPLLKLEKELEQKLAQANIQVEKAVKQAELEGEEFYKTQMQKTAEKVTELQQELQQKAQGEVAAIEAKGARELLLLQRAKESLPNVGTKVFSELHRLIVE